MKTKEKHIIKMVEKDFETKAHKKWVGRSQQNRVALINEINNKLAPEKLNRTLWC